MKVVLTTGYEHSGYQLVHSILRDAGLVAAQPSRRERITAADLQVKLQKALAESGEKPATGSPGKLWEELAVDLFLAHLDTPAWGWGDHRTAPLLDFWRRFDKQTRFVLVYSSPEFAIAQALQGQEATPAILAKVVEAWSDQSKALLTFCRRFPARCQLVNSESALHDPAQLVERLSGRWGVPLKLPDGYVPQREDVSTVAVTLARGAVLAMENALALYAALESGAGSTGNLAGPAQELLAWNEYNAERQAFAAMQLAVKAMEAKLAAASKQAAAALEQQRQQVAALTKARDELQAEVTTLQQKTRKLIEERDAQTCPAAPTHPMMARCEQLERENELFRLQLSQVQDELEHYYLQHLGAASQARPSSVSDEFMRQFWRDNQPSEIIIDLRRAIDGTNWHQAESDGRWAGPEKTSTLRVPPLLPGDYLVLIHVVDTMAPAILNGLCVWLNGVELDLTIPGGGVLPCALEARFSARDEDLPAWEFEFCLPDVIAPQQRGEQDERLLGIRVKAIELILETAYSASADRGHHGVSQHSGLVLTLEK